MIPYGAKLEIDTTYVWAATWPETAEIPGDQVLLTALRYVDGDDVAMASIEKREKRTVFGSYTPKIALTSANVYTPLYMWGASKQVLTEAAWGAGLALKVRSWLQGSTLSDPKPQIREMLIPQSKYIWLAYWPGAVPSAMGIVAALQSVGSGSASVLHTVEHVALGSYSPGEAVNHSEVRAAIESVGGQYVKLHSADDFPFPEWALDAGEKLQNLEIPDAEKAFEWAKLALLGIGLIVLAKIGGK